jgi:hypothetical protein
MNNDEVTITPLRNTSSHTNKPVQLTAEEKRKLMREMRMNAVRKRQTDAGIKLFEEKSELVSPPRTTSSEVFNTPPTNTSPGILSPITPATPVDNRSPTESHDHTRVILRRSPESKEDKDPVRNVFSEQKTQPIDDDAQQFYDSLRNPAKNMSRTITELKEEPQITQATTVSQSYSKFPQLFIIVLIATYSAVLSLVICETDSNPICEVRTKNVFYGITLQHFSFNDPSTWPYVPPLFLFLTIQWALLVPSLTSAFIYVFTRKPAVRTAERTTEDKVMTWFEGILKLLRIYKGIMQFMQNACLYLLTYMIVIATVRIYKEHSQEIWSHTQEL